jgi:DNA polymerase I - 3''-5'' exonuclease and polymerase domains
MQADGRKDAPLLIVMTNQQSDGMMAWFWKMIGKAGIKKIDCRFVYLLDEVPTAPGGKPTKEQIRRSWQRFVDDIENSFPQVVMPMGAHALYYLTGIRENIFDARGYILTSKYFREMEFEAWEQVGVYKTGNKARNVTKGDPKYKWTKKTTPGLLRKHSSVIIPTFDLEYHIRRPGFIYTPAFREDIFRVKRALDSVLSSVDRDFTYYSSFSRLETSQGPIQLSTTPLDKLNWNKDVIAVDIETHGIDNEVIDRVSVSDGEITASLAWSFDACEFLNYLFSLDKPIFAVHNSPFDIPRLRDNGVNISDRVLRTRIFDTMFGAVVLQPDLYKGLGRCTTVYLDCEPWKWDSLIEKDPVFYSAKDAFITALLAKQEIRVMKSLGVWDLFMGGPLGAGVMASIPELTDMTRRGIKTDNDYAKWWVPKLERHQLKLERLWSKQFSDVNPHSTKDLKRLFYTEWGLPVQYTENKQKKRTISTDELACVHLKFYINEPSEEDMGPWRSDVRCTPRVFDLLLTLRDISKTLSTYVKPVGEGTTHYVHPEYMPVSKDKENVSAGKIMSSKGNTATGRLATFGINIGNQPKKIRKLYIPDSDHHCFIEGDWKAAELVAIAFGAGDDRLIEDLKSDIHLRNANRFGITRDVSKNVIYASQYLAGPSKVSKMILEQEHMYVPVIECKRIMDGLKEYYWKTTAFKNYLINQCETKKYIQNPFGRIRCFHDGRAPAAVDFYPQSVVADCLWCVLWPIADSARGLGGRLTTTVYDSILIQVPEEKTTQAADELRNIMQKEFPNIAPGFYLPAEIKIGKPGESWGALNDHRV